MSTLTQKNYYEEVFYNSRASIKFQFLEDYKGAIEDLSKAIELNPKDEDFYFSLANEK